MTDPQRACCFQALAVGMRARSQQMIWRQEITRLQSLSEVLQADDGMRLAVTSFLCRWTVERWNAPAVAEAAAALIRAVERAGWPEAAPQGAI